MRKIKNKISDTLMIKESLGSDMIKESLGSDVSIALK